jgi:hypothetical protein
LIGCLWPSIDNACVNVAGGFYPSLLEGATGIESNQKVASALREAVREVRKANMTMPLFWAQFVHFEVLGRYLGYCTGRLRLSECVPKIALDENVKRYIPSQSAWRTRDPTFPVLFDRLSY